MKQLRLVFAVPVVAIGFWTVAASACDQKSTSASAASTDQAACSQMSAAECKAKMAGHTCSVHGASAASMDQAACTPMSSAECKAKMAAGQPCPVHGASAVNASAVTASATGGCPYSGAAASASGCSHASATSASAAGCAGHATTTSAASGACSAHTVNAMTVSNTPAGVNMYAAAHAGCAAKATGATAGCAEHSVTMAAGLGSTCSGRAAAATAAREGCEACSDLAHAEAELEAAGATMQTVPIKNGVMFVYTAASPGQVNAIQSVMSRRTDHLTRILASGDKAHLCDDCREMRGAMVSGRLVREVVNIEGGTLVLVTSEDPTLIRRIRDLADAGKTAVKS